MDKLKSRKLWVAVVGAFVVAAGNAVGIADAATTAALTAIIVAYLTAQGLIDKNETQAEATKEENQHLVHTIERIATTRTEKDDGYRLYQG